MYNKLRKKQTGKGWFNESHTITGKSNNFGGFKCSCGEVLGEGTECPRAPRAVPKTCECSNCINMVTSPRQQEYLCRCCGSNFNKECRPPSYTTWAQIKKNCGSKKSKTWTNYAKPFYISDEYKNKYKEGTYKVCSMCKRDKTNKGL